MVYFDSKSVKRNGQAKVSFVSPSSNSKIKDQPLFPLLKDQLCELLGISLDQSQETIDTKLR